MLLIGFSSAALCLPLAITLVTPAGVIVRGQTMSASVFNQLSLSLSLSLFFSKWENMRTWERQGRLPPGNFNFTNQELIIPGVPLPVRAWKRTEPRPSQHSRLNMMYPETCCLSPRCATHTTNGLSIHSV